MGKINASHSSYCYDSMLMRSDDKYLRSCSKVEPIDDQYDEDDDDDEDDERSNAAHRAPDHVAWLAGKIDDLRKTTSSGSSDDEQDTRTIRYVPDILERIDENRLVYRAEGNANIVLSLSDNKHVLRMRKSNVETRDGKSDTNVDLRRFVKYSKVIASLFSECYVPAPKLAHLNTCNLQVFNERLRCFRPAMRLGKEIRELDGILYPDVAFLPKWLYPARVRDFGQLQKKSIAKISKYCPLDLYSGKPLRVLQAVKGLIGAPQNNFKILKNGKIVYDDKREKSMFNRILREMFPRDGRTKDERSTIFINLIKEILLKDFTTNDEHCDRKLLSIKKDRKKSSISAIDASTLTKSRTDPYSYIDDMYEKYMNYKEDTVYDGHTSTTWPKESFCTEYLSEEEKYQLGATALDCSIMITFRRLSGDRAEENSLNEAARNHIVSIEGMKFLVNVTITDLDPKSHKHYAKYVEQLGASAVAYREFMSRVRR
uniref:Inositol-pentakisphosphate 2-kinase n=1 Tax=Anopheles minimus TaxID=112268 RepID=A0A182VTF0_9DIPT